jgi:hypothetical protein
MPPGMQEYTLPPAGKGSNVPAILSLICGILGCIPVITSLAALILGLVGISLAKNPRVGGKGLAIAGLILGIIGLLLWGGIGAGMYWGYSQAMKLAVRPTTGLMSSLSAGDLQKARTFVTANVTDEELLAASNSLKNMGQCLDAKFRSFEGSATGGRRVMQLTGTAVFEKGQKQLTVHFGPDPNGELKITSFTLE